MVRSPAAGSQSAAALPGTPRSTLFPASMPRAAAPVKQKGAEAPFEANGAPGEIRTPDHQVRSLVLYPTELRARAACISPTALAAAAETRNYSEPDRLRQHPPCNPCVPTPPRSDSGDRRTAEGILPHTRDPARTREPCRSALSCRHAAPAAPHAQAFR